MERILKFFLIHKTVFTFLLCMVLSTILIFLNKEEQKQVTKLREISADISGSITQKLNWFSRVFVVLKDNKRLIEENQQLSFENEIAREIKAENERLRELLEFKKRIPYELKTGEIVQWYTPVLSTVKINLGKKDGVKRNDPVRTTNGLVGKIIAAGENYSICQLLTDGSFRVSVQIRNSDVVGFLRYKENKYATIKDIRSSANVAVGDTVVTSRHGNIYPLGIPIGSVVDFTDDPGLFKTITVELFVNYATLKEVSVIVNVNPDY